MNKFVSIIVPTYNVEPYIRQCLDSIVNQTLKEIEIICVDDGSTDKSGEILDEYAAKDSRIKVIHKENGGYGKAMNIGLDNAAGEYIGIVEPDDFIELNMFEVLYNHAKAGDLDFIKADYFKYTSIPKPKNEKFSQFCKEKIYDKIINPNQHLETFNGGASIWSAIYKRSFLVDAGIRFLETPGASFQDTSFWIKVLFESKKAVFINNAFYHYRCDNENSSVKDNSKIFCVCDEITELENRYKSPEQIQIINALKIDKYTWNYNRLTEEARREFFPVYNVSLKEIIDKKLYMQNLIPDGIIVNCERILSSKLSSAVVSVYSAKKVLKRLFSVVNSEDRTHKVVTILGINIKFKRKQFNA